MIHLRGRTIWIRVGIAATMVFVVRLAAATEVLAQTAAEGPRSDTVPLKAEFGGTVAATIVLPDFGLIASVPLARRLALEATVARMPPFLEEAPAHVLAQAQLRVPFRQLLQSRRSVLVGVTTIGRIHGPNDFFGSRGTYVRPHLGVGFEWPVAGTPVDFRFDVQGIVCYEQKLPVIPRMMAAWVVHPRKKR